MTNESEARAVERQDRIEGFDDILDYFIHELRNPIAVVKGFAATLKGAVEQGDDATLATSADAIRRSADKLDALLGTFKDVRSLDLSNLVIHPREVLVSELVTDTLADMQVVVGDHDLEVAIEDDVMLLIDPVKIRQVLVNLISNAVKFGPSDSTIRLIVSRRDADVQISIEDGGPVIPPERVDELFKKFSRLGRTESGTGLGLYVSRGLARAHRGDLVLDGEPSGGNRFILTLPIHHSEPELDGGRVDL